MHGPYPRVAYAWPTLTLSMHGYNPHPELACMAITPTLLPLTFNLTPYAALLPLSFQAVRWLHKRITVGKKYKSVKVADAYGPDPGLELAEQALDPVPEGGAAKEGGAPPPVAAGVASAADWAQTAAEAEAMFAEPAKGERP